MDDQMEFEFEASAFDPAFDEYLQPSPGPSHQSVSQQSVSNHADLSFLESFLVPEHLSEPTTGHSGLQEVGRKGANLQSPEQEGGLPNQHSAALFDFALSGEDAAAGPRPLDDGLLESLTSIAGRLEGQVWDFGANGPGALPSFEPQPSSVLDWNALLSPISQSLGSSQGADISNATDFSALFAQESVPAPPQDDTAQGSTPSDFELLQSAQQRIFELQQQLETQRRINTSSASSVVSAQSPITFADVSSTSVAGSVTSDSPASAPHVVASDAVLPPARPAHAAGSNNREGKKRKLNDAPVPGASASANKPFTLKPAFMAALSGKKPSGSTAATSSLAPKAAVSVIASAGLPKSVSPTAPLKPAMLQRTFKAAAPSLKSTSRVGDSVNAALSNGPILAPKSTEDAQKAAMDASRTETLRLAKEAEKRMLDDQRRTSTAFTSGPEPTGHNAVEKRYRENINGHITSLRDLIPALAHLRDPVSYRASTPSASPQFPIEGTMVDGVLVASKLSKGTILGRAVDYVKSLKAQRRWLEEDIDELEKLVKKMVAGGNAVVGVFEEGRKKKTAARDKALRRLAEGGELPAEFDCKVQPTKKAKAQVEKASSLDQNKASLPADIASTCRRHSEASLTGPETVSSTGSSPLRSSGPATSPHSTSTTSSNSPRPLFAAFLGLSFVGGAGYDYLGRSERHSTTSTPGHSVSKAWLMSRRVIQAGVPAAAFEPPIFDHRDRSVSTGLLCVGLASAICVFAYLVWPLVNSLARPGKAKRERVAKKRQAALQLLASSQIAQGQHVPIDRVYEALQVLTGTAGTSWLSMSLALVLQASLAMLGWATGWRVSEKVIEEDAAAWLRIAELECCGVKSSSVTKAYTFFRLLNLSRSPFWPGDHPLTTQSRVKGVLTIHCLRHSHLPSSIASFLWSRASLKKSDAVDAWTALAVSTEFSELNRVLSRHNDEKVNACTPATATLPLLMVAECRYEVALMDAWAKFFVAVVRATCLPTSLAHMPRDSDGVSAPTLAAAQTSELEADADVVRSALASMRMAIEDIHRNTVLNTTLHAWATVTLGLWYAAFGHRQAARELAKLLTIEAKGGGPAQTLSSARSFVALVFGPSSPWLSYFSLGFPAAKPHSPAGIEYLSCATLEWLLIRQKFASFAAKASPESARTPRPTDPSLHQDTLQLRRLLASPALRMSSIVEASAEESGGGCATRGQQLEFDITDAVDLCVDALTTVGRKALGRVTEDDSGCDLSD